MFDVSFPGLGININVNPVAFSFGNTKIYWYGIIIAVGFILALICAIKRCKFYKQSADKLTNCAIFGLIFAIIGARLYYVIFSWDNYKDDPLKILNIHEGGLAIYGGLIGGLIGGLVPAKIQKMNVPACLDLCSISFLIGQGIGRWGNFMNQEAFGSATNLPWRMVSENTNGVGVHPCFLYESIWCLLGALFIYIFSKKWQKYYGQAGILYLLWYGFGRTIIEGLRTDSLYLPFKIFTLNVRVSQMLSAIMVITAIILLIVFRNRTDDIFVKKEEK